MPEVHLVNLEKVEFFGGEEDKKNEILPKTRLIDPSLAVESGIII